MSYRTSSFGGSFGGGSFGFRVTPWVRRLLIANGAVFLLFAVLGLAGYGALQRWFWFTPALILERPWSLFTYAFVHAGVFHILFNMLALFFFGPPLEERWGSRGFIRFYLVAAAGGALFSLAEPGASVVGASAAVNGLLLAFAMTWPNMPIHVWGIFPVPAKWLVGIMALFSVFAAAGGGPPGVAHWAHLGGFVTALLYLKSPWAPSPWGDVPVRTPPKKRTRGVPVPWGGKKTEVAAPKPVPAKAGARPTGKAERELLDDVDRILDKISAEGLESLSEEERRRLDEVSRRYRTN